MALPAIGVLSDRQKGPQNEFVEHGRGAAEVGKELVGGVSQRLLLESPCALQRQRIDDDKVHKNTKTQNIILCYPL